MKSDFESVYKEIKKQENELEKLRLTAGEAGKKAGAKFTKYLMFIILGTFLMPILFTIVFSLPEKEMKLFFDIIAIFFNDYMLIFYLVFGLCIVLWGTNKNADIKKRYEDSYGELVIKPLVKVAGKDLEYLPEQELDKNLYEAAGFFGDSSIYKSYNLIKGKYENYDLEWSFIKTGYRGDDSTEFEFQGVFVICNCINNIDANIKIISQRPLEINFFDKENIKKIELDSIEFEKYFNIYGDEAIKVYQFITVDVMERILEFRKKYGYKFDISIKSNKIYIRFEKLNGMFTAPLDWSATDINATQYIYNVISRSIYFSKYLAETLNEQVI